jgi:prepilin-type processing-associated H-X9-DG protein
MSNVETRHVNRDSLFLLAQLRVAGQDDLYRVKVRNLSAGGMMAEGAVPVQRGQQVAVELRNIGWVDGSVAWKQDDRFGIAFLDEIDPAHARAAFSAPAPAGVSQAHKARGASAAAPDNSRLRKI